MRFESRMGRSAGLAGVFGGIVFSLLMSSGVSRSANAVVQEEKSPAPQDFQLLGSLTCQTGCHDQATPKMPSPTEGYKFIRLWENVVWDAHDLHSRAFKNIVPAKNTLAKSMEINLKKGKGEAYKVTEDVKCLACHASHTKLFEVDKPANWTLKSFETADGVGCEMCHGLGSAYRPRHDAPKRVADPAPGEPTAIVEWREWDPVKKTKWGFTDLRSPVAATATCASCHIGSQKDGRFVTHEMYAAGHPPLPPLDLMAYSREQPRHWGLPSQMPYLVNLAEKDAKKAFDTFHYRSEKVESSVVRRFVESTIAALRSTAALTSQLADEAKPKNDGLDFAAFDCYSCHHDLKYPSDRQARGYDGPPGRPQFRVAPFALARTVVGDEELGKQLDAARRELAFSFGNRSYGDPEAIGKAVAKVSAWCDTAMAKVNEKDYLYDAKRVAALLDRIKTAAAAEAPRPVGDPELAQLYLWAVTTLALDKKEEGKLPDDVIELRKKLDKTVVSRLRPGLPFDFEVKADAKINDSQKPVSERIGNRMSIFNAFEGKVFRDAFSRPK